MNDERSFERFVAHNVAGGAGSVRLPDEFYDDIHAFASGTRQRPEWLALIKEPPMRIDSTLGVGSPVARLAITAATTVLMAVLGTGALIAGAQSPDPATPDPMAAVTVTGRLGPVDVAPDGSTATALDVTSSDPRLGGVFTDVANGDEYPGDIGVSAFRTEIRDDGGAWVGTGTGYAAEGVVSIETLVLAGEGAHAGLTAYLILDWNTPGRPFKGIIFPGEMPEPPPAQ